MCVPKMRYTSCAVAGIALTAVALGVCSSSASHVRRENFMDESKEADKELANDAEILGQEEDSTESVAVQVAEIQGMNESDLKLELRSLYSTSKDAQEKQIYPAGCLEAIQEVLNTLGSVDDEQRDVNQFMHRYAFLVAKVLDSYNDFFAAKVTLGDPKLTGEEYKKEVKKLPKLAAKWTKANELLVNYLTLGAKDLKGKWEQSATTEKRLRDVLSFIERLVEVYEAQQRLFRMGFGLAKLRYMEYEDRQADLTALMDDPRQKQAVLDFEDALENIKEVTHQARKAAVNSVQDGILAPEFLMLLPFPPDKQREMDDLPKDEM